MKKQMYIIWIEGLEPKTGEKVRRFVYNNDRGWHIEYTCRMDQALRVRQDQIGRVNDLLKACGVADWVINGNTFVRTSYAPKGTRMPKIF